MTELVQKHFGIEKIKDIVNNKDYDEISENEFIRFIDQTLKNEEEDGCDDEDKAGILRYADEYMSIFVWERKRGFSVAWAKEYADKHIKEEEDNAPAYAYKAARKINSAQALADLRLYAELTNRDELFIKHFAFLIEADVPNPTPSVESQAEEYSRLFKQQIAKGKSEIFANHYSDLMATNDSSEFESYIEAAEYEKAILDGFNHSYSSIFAEKISDYIVNHWNNYEESFNDPLVIMERKRLEKLFEHLK